MLCNFPSVDGVSKPVRTSDPRAEKTAAEEDDELVRRSLAGETDAFQALVERHRDVVFRVAARVVGAGDADDVSQDAFLRAFHRLSRYRQQGAFRAWLLQITHNAAVTAATRRRPESVDPASAALESAALGSREPAERLESSERRERLESKILGLRPAHRTVLVLRDVEGLSYEEISDVTDTPLGSVKGRINRARTEMIDLLRTNTYDWDLPE
jgi:RNA polymerase sigma-70 factor (ECF subfamily)